MYYNENTIIYLDGSWMKASEANTGLYSQTLHYGNGVFEGIRSYEAGGEPQIFKAKEHFERLKYSADSMHMDFDYSTELLTSLTYELLERNDLTDAYIRPLVYLGANMSMQTSQEVHLLLSAWEWGKYLGNSLLNIMTSSYERPNPKSCNVEAKVTGHYTNSILATSEAKKQGFDDALMTDMNGFVAEGASANFFFEKDGTLFTSPRGSILSGITRATIIELAQEAGMSLEEKLFTPDEVRGADAAFFTGTAAEVAGIASLDGIPFKLEWEDSLGYQLSELYQRRVRSTELVYK